MNQRSSAESLLLDLGVTAPDEIDLEAIAWHLGARVKYRKLDECAARIVGFQDRAIISVDTGSKPRRQRYSIGHELGHWRWHRGKTLACRSGGDYDFHSSKVQIERLADAYAADLLMPRFLFDPEILSLRSPTVQAVKKLADTFLTSMTATAVRVVESRHSCALLVCHGKKGRKWFVRSPNVPEKWFPQDELDVESCAFEMLHGTVETKAHPQKIGADAWFGRREASAFTIKEQSFRGMEDEVLTILEILDERMLDQ